jgi:zinc protease
MDELPKHYDKVTPQDLKRIANIYFVKDNLSSMYLLPEDSKE